MSEKDMEVSAPQISVLLAFMLHGQPLLSLACAHLQPSYIKQYGTTAQVLMFDVLQQFWGKFERQAPSLAVFFAELRAAADRYAAFNQDLRGQIEEEARIVHGMFEHTRAMDPGSVDYARQIVLKIHRVCGYEHSVREIATTVAAGGDVDGLGARFSDAEDRHKVLLGGSSVAGLTSMAFPPESAARFKTNIPFIDTAIGKGLGPFLGCAIGIIAPQGVGKTTLGIQFLCEQVVQARHVLLALAEEGISYALRLRIISCIMEVDKTELERINCDVKRVHTISKLQPDEIQRRAVLLDSHMHVLDMVKNSGVAQDIETEAAHLISVNQCPVVIYVDWAGPIAMNEMNQPRNKNKRKDEILKQLSTRLSEMAARMNNIVIIAHQMASADVLKGPFTQHSVNCASECRGFTEPMKYVVVVGVKEPKTGLHLLTMPKTRDDIRPAPVLVHINGFSKMVQEYGFMMRGKRFVRADTDMSLNSVPSEKRNTNHVEI
jgi:hypothetical protein